MQEHRSIEQIENDFWKEVDFPSGLVEKCFAYRKIPIAELSVEQLRLLISQSIGLPYIISRAVCILQQNILSEGDYYQGDLLSVLLELKHEDWQQNLKEKAELKHLIVHSLNEIEANENQSLMRKVRAFLS